MFTLMRGCFVRARTRLVSPWVWVCEAGWSRHIGKGHSEKIVVAVSNRAEPHTAASTQARGETVVIMGGGIAGLSIALALRGSPHQVVIVERDPEPPEIDPAQAFELWKRPGVFQFRHPHVFLGRLHRLLRERYPDLLGSSRRPASGRCRCRSTASSATL